MTVNLSPRDLSSFNVGYTEEAVDGIENATAVVRLGSADVYIVEGERRKIVITTACGSVAVLPSDFLASLV